MGSQESPEVVGRRNDVAVFQSLLTTLPSINQLVNHLGCLVSQPVARPISVVINSAKKELARRLEFCLHSLGRRVVGRPLEEITNLPRHRSGRKKGQNKEENDELLRMTVLGLVRDAHNRSVYSYLSDNQLLNLRTSLERFVNSDTRLKYIVTGNRRADPALRREAVDIVRRRLGGVEEEGDVEDKTRSIYEYRQLKTIANNLNYSQTPRKTRDGECFRTAGCFALTCLSRRLIVAFLQVPPA